MKTLIWKIQLPLHGGQGLGTVHHYCNCLLSWSNSSAETIIYCWEI